MNRRRFTFFALLYVGCGTAAPAEEGDEELPAVHVECAPVLEGAFADVRTLDGVVVTPPERSAMLSSQLPGVLREVLVREGDLVAAGMRVANVDPGTAADAARLAEARLAQATATSEHAQRSLARSTRLVDRGIAARQELDDASAHAGEMQAALLAARASRTEAQRLLSRAHITSPIAGVVTRVLRHQGELVDGTPLMPILEVADTHDLEIQASAAARDLVSLARDQHVTVDFPDVPGLVLEGRVQSVAPAIDPATGTGPVRVALILTEGVHLPLGLRAHIRIDAGTHHGLSVPLRALRGRSDGGTEVLICEDGVLSARRVRVGMRGDRAEILEGLEGSESIAVDPVLGIDDGTRIEDTEAP